MRRAWVLAVLGLSVVRVTFAQGEPVQPVLAFEESAVTASGLTPGKTVVWFGVEHAVDADYSGDIYQHQRTGTASADGRARLDLDHALAPRSLWVAVDLDTGSYDMAGPNGYRLAKPEKLPRLASGQSLAADALLDAKDYIVGVMVRPGTGAWAFAGGDGGPLDDDGQGDGQIRFAVDRFRPLPGSSAAPATIEAEDLWFVIDPMTMEISLSLGGVAQ